MTKMGRIGSYYHVEVEVFKDANGEKRYHAIVVNPNGEYVKGYSHSLESRAVGDALWYISKLETELGS